VNENYTVGRYLLSRLQRIGVKHVFGVPGDYNLDFLDAVLESPIRWVGNCNELNAGYAADGYARLNGVGAAAVTYGVGGLSILNAVAGAFAEHVPVIVINGAPPSRRRESGALVHHLVSNYYLQLDIYRKITADATLLADPKSAPDEIDRVIRNCLALKLPAYLELPADITRAHAARQENSRPSPRRAQTRIAWRSVSRRQPHFSTRRGIRSSLRELNCSVLGSGSRPFNSWRPWKSRLPRR
jgi:TPP-dependent 2-oxoacid decarboxylase